MCICIIILILLQEKELSLFYFILMTDITKTCTPFPTNSVPNINPPPWPRTQRVGQTNGVNFNFCPPVLSGVSAEELAWAEKKYILQNNKTPLTKNQIYSQVVKGLWKNPKRGYASQTDTYTEPNTNVLQRNNYQFLNVDSGQPYTLDPNKPANTQITTCIQPSPTTAQPKLPILAPPPTSKVPPPTLPPPPSNPSSTSNKATLPKKLPIVPPQPTVIAVNGSLNCSVTQSICLGLRPY